MIPIHNHLLYSIFSMGVFRYLPFLGTVYMTKINIRTWSYDYEKIFFQKNGDLQGITLFH